MQQLSLSIMEIFMLMAIAITLGITIHFFIVSRRNLKTFYPEVKTSQPREDWRLRYFNDLEKKNRELLAVQREISELIERNRILSRDNEDLKARLRQADSDRTNFEPVIRDKSKQVYLDKLKQTQEGLYEQNEKIAQLLEQIEQVREQEGSKEDYKLMNEELRAQVAELQERLSAKEEEADSARQKTDLALHMSSMLDNAYQEFNVLQEKILKLEGQVSSSRKMSLEYEDLREGFFKASRDLDEQRHRLTEVLNENQVMQQELAETAEKLREANFQRQQLQKRVAYLEDLNQDLQTVAETNRKLESQLKRIGELESLLHVLAVERDELAKRQVNATSL
jgi:chromosome segregation ATPase